MLDARNKKNLVDHLRGRIKKASSNVSTKIEANKGDFKVVIASDNITQLYQNQEVGRIRIAELNDDEISIINEDPQEFAQDALETFASTFDVESFEKTAANEVIDSETAQMTTEKQLNEQKTKLHPRQDEAPTVTTQKQIPQAGLRPGTYDITTEGQFREERKTFYDAPRTSGDWKNEDRNVVTEAQFEEGVGEYSEVATTDRGEMGAQYDGDLAMQHKQIGEKQLAELLSHHEWTEPLTITEGKDQLGKQEGELARISVTVAEKIMKEALNALGNTVLSVGITPKDLAGVVKKLVSHQSKYPALANTIQLYAGSDISVINNKVADAQYFGKTVNAAKNWSPMLAADVFVRQLSKLSHNPRFIVEGLVALAENGNLETQIDESVNTILSTKPEEKVAESNVSIFKQILAGETEEQDYMKGSDEDGVFAYRGTIEEVQADVTNRHKFVNAAADYAKNKVSERIGRKIELIAQAIDVNEDKGIFEITFVDNEKNEAQLKARAEKRRELAKEASIKQSQMGGAGGMPPAAGGEMANPMAPPGAADMGAPPVGEALSQEPPMPDEGEEVSGEPKPPGSICPVCGKDDVDVDNGEFRCNGCGAEGEVSVKLDVFKWPETIKEEEEGMEEEGFGLGAEEEGMGLGEELGEGMGGVGEGTTMPNVPVGASVKNILEKLASQKRQPVLASTFRLTPTLLNKLAEAEIRPGTVCPNCGSNNTDILKSANTKGEDGVCYDCHQEYVFKVRTAKNKKNTVYANYIWAPVKTAEECSGCNRIKEAFLQSLANYGTTWEHFDNLKSMQEQGDLILKMASAGSLELTDAMKSTLPIQKIAASPRWKGYGNVDKFPSTSCLERLNRRFGENASSMSGPCQGKKLAECVCGQLESLGIYTDGLAAKVASAQASKDPMINAPMKTCVAMFLKDDYSFDDACVACDGLRAAYASVEDLVIEAIAQVVPGSPKPMAMPKKPMPAPGNVKDPATKPMGQPKPMSMPSDMGMPAPMDAAPMSAPDMNNSKPMEAAPMSQPGAMPEPDMASPLEANPMDSPVEDLDLENGMDDGMDDFELEFEGDLSDTGLDLGLEGDEITIQLPQQAAEAIKVLFDAIQGQLGDEFIDETEEPFGEDTFEEDTLDVGDVTEDIVDENNETNEENNDEGFLGGDDDSIPGLAEEETEETGELTKEGPGEKDCGAPCNKPCNKAILSETDADSVEKTAKEKWIQEAVDKPGAFTDYCGGDVTEECIERGKDSPNTKTRQRANLADTLRDMPHGKKSSNEGDIVREASVDNTETADTERDVREASNLEKMLMSMKTGTLKTRQEASNSLFDGLFNQIQQAELRKQAKTDGGIKKMEYKGASEGSKIKTTPAQETSGIGEYSAGDGSKMGYEEKFSADNPDVPRAAATIGDEDSSNTVNDKEDVPTVPNGSPAMAGEEHFRPEKGNEVDGNQGAQTTASQKGKTMKKANTKVARNWTVPVGHKHYDALMKKAQAGESVVRMTDENDYDLSLDQNDNIILIVRPQEEKIAKNTEIKKESQTVSPKKVDTFVDDPDINQTSGPGKGKVRNDQPHSLGVDEKKPSEGMNEPSVPEAPNSGQLVREHTYTNELDGPAIPAGGGTHPDYDQNEKNNPEKLDQMLGKQNDLAAMASDNRDEAIKIAGQMLKANLITADELPMKVRELSKATPHILRDIENLVRQAHDSRGMRKAAQADSVETPIIQRTAGTAENQSELKQQIQGLFRLEQRNRDFEKYTQEQGDAKIWR